MKRLQRLGLAVTAVTALAVLAGAAPKGKQITWFTDYKKAQQAAAGQKKIMMVDIYTDWCGPCKKLEKETYPDPKVVALASKLISVKLNPEKSADGKSVSEKYNVEGYPTILFLDAKGKKVHEWVGYAPPADFAAEIKSRSTLLASERISLKKTRKIRSSRLWSRMSPSIATTRTPGIFARSSASR